MKCWETDLFKKSSFNNIDTLYHEYPCTLQHGLAFPKTTQHSKPLPHKPCDMFWAPVVLYLEYQFPNLNVKLSDFVVFNFTNVGSS